MVGAFGAGLAGGATVAIVIRAVDKFSGVFGRASKGMRILSSVFKVGALGIATAGAALTAIGISATKAAINFEEIQSKFTTVFESISEESEIAAKDLAKNFLLSERAAKELLSTTGDLLTGVGFTDKAALDLSVQVQELGADLASFSNIEGGTERASRALTKALLGEREMLKELGISILESDVQTRLAEEGMSNLTGVALKAAKAQITLQLAIEQSPKAIGDVARTSDSAANRIRSFQAAFEDMQVTLGQAVLPVFQEFLTILRDEIMPMLQPLIPLLGDLLKNAMAALIPFIQTIAQVFSEMGRIIFEQVLPAYKPLIPVLQQIFTQLAEAVPQITQAFIPSMQEMVPTVVELLEALLPLLPFLISFVVKLIEVAVTITKAVLPAVRAAIGIFKSFSPAITSFIGLLTKLLDILKKVLEVVLQFATSAVTKVFGIIANIGATLIRGAENRGKSRREGKGKTAGDFILRPNGDFIRTDPRDTIVGFKGGAAGGGMGTPIVVNIGTVQGVNAEDIADALQRELRQIVFTT